MVLCASAAAAHDFWLATPRWHVAPGATVTVTANVGDDIYPLSESATAPERVDFCTRGNRRLAVATISRDGERLQAELAMEREA